MQDYAAGRSLRILSPGDWTAWCVSQAWVLNSRRMVPEVESAIETAWAAAINRPGIHLFDGPMCRVESWHTTDTRLRLTLSKSSYKTFLGTNMAHPEFAERFGPEVMANPVGISPALLTADGHLLLGHRTESVAYYPGRIHPFSGAMEPSDLDLFAAVSRELKEELSMDAADIADMRCTGIAEDRNLQQPELIFAVESSRTRAEIQARLDPVEHQSMFAIAANAGAVEKIISEEPRLTPVAIAALLLWGRLRFGQAWFEKMRAGYAS